MTTRKDFLVAGAVAAAAIPAVAQAQSTPKLDFDLKGFTALLSGPQEHKHLFTATELNGGEVFDAMRNTLNAYRDLGIAWSDVAVAAVLYHGPSIFLALDDAFWNTYLYPYAQKSTASTRVMKQLESLGKSTSGNPLLTKLRGFVTDVNARFFVCNNAAHGFSEYLASALMISGNAVYADLAAHLAPNAMLVPAGVWAVHAVQEQHYTLLQTSLAPNA
jgi:hypothetical protein